MSFAVKTLSKLYQLIQEEEKREATQSTHLQAQNLFICENIFNT